MAEAPRLGRACAIAAAAWLAAAACSPVAGETEESLSPNPPRAGRFGSLRDFVLFELVGSGRGGERWLFVDRFEVTRGDWLEFSTSPAGVRVEASSAARLGDRALPVGRVSLRQARAFAAWRFARLPRAEEWEGAALGSGRLRLRFPWGSKIDPGRANTSELGLGEPTLVGTFESGRRAIGQPYDLVGNVSEWTETVPVEWCLLDDVASDDVAGDATSLAYNAGLDRARAAPAVALWQPLRGVLPAITAVADRSDEVPREVVGADFQSSMNQKSERVLAGSRRLRTGVRLVVTPRELLAALLAADVVPVASDYEQLDRFLARKGHRAVLAAAWLAVAPEPAPGERPLTRWLRERLRP